MASRASATRSRSSRTARPSRATPTSSSGSTPTIRRSRTPGRSPEHRARHGCGRLRRLGGRPPPRPSGGELWDGVRSSAWSHSAAGRLSFRLEVLTAAILDGRAGRRRRRRGTGRRAAASTSAGRRQHGARRGGRTRQGVGHAPLETLFAELGGLEGGERVVHAGSAWVLAPGVGLDESAAVDPRSPYARHKAEEDELLPRLGDTDRGRLDRTSASSTSSGATRSRRALLPYLVSRLVARRAGRCLPRRSGARLQRRRRHRARPSRWLSRAPETRAGRSTTSAPAGRRRCASSRHSSPRSLGDPELIRFGAGLTADEHVPALVADATRVRGACSAGDVRDSLEERLRGARSWWLARLHGPPRPKTTRGAPSMTTCRTCKSDHLYLFLPLGDHPLANGFLREEQLEEPEAPFPLDVHVCLDCGLIQVADQVPAEYFRHYVYIPSSPRRCTGTSPASPARSDERFLSVRRTALTVDIGCNDGLFLLVPPRSGARGRSGSTRPRNIAELAREKGPRGRHRVLHARARASDPRGTRPGEGRRLDEHVPSHRRSRPVHAGCDAPARRRRRVRRRGSARTRARRAERVRRRLPRARLAAHGEVVRRPLPPVRARGLRCRAARHPRRLDPRLRPPRDERRSPSARRRRSGSTRRPGAGSSRGDVRRASATASSASGTSC